MFSRQFLADRLDVEKVKPLWVGLRAEYGQPQWAGWFELLNNIMVERLEKKK